MAHFKVREITFLGRETPKTVVLCPHYPGNIVGIFTPLGVQNTKKFLPMG